MPAATNNDFTVYSILKWQLGNNCASQNVESKVFLRQNNENNLQKRSQRARKVWAEWCLTWGHARGFVLGKVMEARTGQPNVGSTWCSWCRCPPGTSPTRGTFLSNWKNNKSYHWTLAFEVSLNKFSLGRTITKYDKKTLELARWHAIENVGTGGWWSGALMG